ncbi:uncharacterized protein E0L32_003959 [Thyridium curvatum]|uniref:Uncharacterized protein n=1 Tax=Thyridium curvatum TaxID=1093900 RepID=A0A507BI99_9PEZI|nr:uncharacterized protein E0L32_003959 [Thyridium curvatum]TPX16310.1 hypothetical protein E0L32_003959 [Thyridium curvatum]
MSSSTGKSVSRGQKKKREDVRALDNNDLAARGNASFQVTPPTKNDREIPRKEKNDKPPSKKKISHPKPTTPATKNSSDPSGLGPDIHYEEIDSFNTLGTQYPGCSEDQSCIDASPASQFAFAGQETLNQVSQAPGTNSWLCWSEHEGLYNGPGSNDDALEHGTSVSSSQLTMVEAEGRGHLSSKWRESIQAVVASGSDYGPVSSSTQPVINSESRPATRMAVGRTESSRLNKKQDFSQNVAIAQERDYEGCSRQHTTQINITQHQNIVPTFSTSGREWPVQYGRVEPASDVKAPSESTGSNEGQYSHRHNAKSASCSAQKVALLEGKIAELHKKVRNEQDASRAAAERAEGTLSTLRQRYHEDLLKAQQERRECDQSWKKEMADLRADHSREIERLEIVIQEQQRDQELEKQRLAQQHYQEILDLEAHIAETERLWNNDKKVDAERYEGKLTTIAARHSETMTEMATKHDLEKGAICGTYEDQLQQAREEYSRDVDRLTSYILSDNITIPDADLGIAFERISQGIIDLSCCIQQESYVVDAALDPTNFLGHGRGELRSWSWHRLFRNICWATLARGFFSYPGGLGALGKDGRGHETIYPYYELCSGQKDGVLSSLALQTCLDKETSFSKAWLLGKIRDGIRALNDPASDKTQFITLFEENIESVTRSLVDVLERASGGKLNPERVREVASISRQSGLLALDMGSQRAQIVMQCCTHEERLVWGAGFECESPPVGLETARLGLLTKPCLKRVGDGRKDFTTETMIVCGTFVHSRSGWAQM